MLEYKIMQCLFMTTEPPSSARDRWRKNLEFKGHIISFTHEDQFTRLEEYYSVCKICMYTVCVMLNVLCGSGGGLSSLKMEPR